MKFPNRKCKHGHRKGGKASPTARSWAHILDRCNNPNNERWEAYGGRGITVCDRWLVFTNFLADMGERPSGKSIDRIENDRGYEPGNCRWATAKEQAQNRRPPIRLKNEIEKLEREMAGK